MKEYKIYIEQKMIGTTKLEKADPPMGVVFGKIEFNEVQYKYQFFKEYCLTNNIELRSDYPKDKLLSTATIEQLKIVNDEGIEIKGVGNQIMGMDEDGFEISIEGIPYLFYEEEFPHHRKAYDERFK